MSNLIYTVAKVSFAALPSEQFEAVKEQLHMALRINYPFFDIANEQVINISLADNIPTQSQEFHRQYKFASADKRWGVVIGAGGIVLHTNRYESFTLLASKMEEILGLLHQFMAISHTLFVGVRYFNKIDPIEEQGDFSFNINRPEILQPVVNCQPYIAGHRMRSVYENDDGMLVFQSGIVTKGPLLPVEYLPLLAQLGHKHYLVSDVCGYIDIDSCFKLPEPELFDVTDVIAKMNKLRLQAKAVYSEVIG